MIPSFLLAKLYVKGSLKNHEKGFEFALKNIIDSTMLIGIGPISVGEKNYEGGAIDMTVGDKTVNGAELSRTNSVQVRMGVPMKVSVTGDKLEVGTQRVTVAATTSDIGKIKFDINDSVA
jgi:hydroxymethylglutaryl-CoA reductase (NADPH)